MKNSILRAFLLIAFVVATFAGFSQRIIGYFPNYNYGISNYTTIQYGNMTHLYYFSMNPRDLGGGTSDGTLWNTTGDPFAWFNVTNFDNVVARARLVNPNIKIFIVTGGAPGGDGTLNTRLYSIATTPSKLNTFCNSLCTFIKNKNIDGWDLDWEFPSGAAQLNAHEAMLAKMRQKIDSMKLADCKYYEITIAVGGGYTDVIPKACWNPAHTDYINANVMNIVDFINVMTYDGNIGAAPCSFSSHQHYNLVVKAMGDWTADFPTWPKSKMGIGVGFYDNSFVAFNSIGNVNTRYNNATYWPTGGSGCTNMQSKIDFARTQGYGGLIIWELTQDNNNCPGGSTAGGPPGCYSLLYCIKNHISTTWGNWSAPAPPCTLPVIWEKIEAEKTKSATSVSWITASEKDNSYFIVEGSADGTYFTTLGKVSSKGNSTEATTYNWTGSTRDLIFFRVAQFDLDGSLHFSQTVKVTTDDIDLNIFPNPFNDEFEIKLNNSSEDFVKVVLENSSGQIISEEIFSNNSTVKIGKALKSGLYVIKVTCGDEFFIRKIIKY
ncbi:MAG: T9SS type A sorting domain-containing protein [Cytophagaceae bacterium]|nr:T9SS type A sorting domain-containing protein [Cytophagaceae bacterium]